MAKPGPQSLSAADGNAPACQAVATSKTGAVNNTIQVKRTDFEVFDALRIDSEDTADVSGSGRRDQSGPPRMR